MVPQTAAQTVDDVMTVAKQRVEDSASAGRRGLQTGKEYLESLNDDREVWINGRRVKDVANHPAFRNSARMIARLYDALHDPEKTELLTIPIDNGSGMRTHRFFQAPRSIEEQVAARDAIVEWARMTYGWMGRTPDYKAAWFGTLGIDKEIYHDFQAQADRWYRVVRERFPISATRSSIRRSTVTCRTSFRMSSCGSTRRPTPGSSSAAQRSSRPARR